LKEKCPEIFILKGYEGKDGKITLPDPPSRKFVPLFWLYNHILKVIFELCRPVISNNIEIEIRPMTPDSHRQPY